MHRETFINQTMAFASPQIFTYINNMTSSQKMELKNSMGITQNIDNFTLTAKVAKQLAISVFDQTEDI
jgi:hypothetical protein